MRFVVTFDDSTGMAEVRNRLEPELAPHANRTHPTTEHFLPLLMAKGAAPAPLPATVLNGGIRHGMLAMESYVFGSHFEISIEEQDHA